MSEQEKAHRNIPSTELSMVIPVYNEEAVLPALFERLYPALDAIGRSFEVVFVDDGSKDRSAGLLRDQHQKRPDATQVVLLRTNAGQHAAILAGFEFASGRYVVTLDADLQNPPEEIPKLVAALDEGHDYVGSIRRVRQDSFWRHWASSAANSIRERITKIHITDQGCMFRAYHRDIVAAVLESREVQTYIPALAYLYAANPTEIMVEHEKRAAGETKYSLFKLIHLNFDLMTAFSVLPLQLFSVMGMGIAIISFIFTAVLAIRRIIFGPEVQGVFTLFGVVFFLIGILLFGIGILGEYLVRVYIQVRERPCSLVRTVLERSEPDPPVGGSDDETRVTNL
jgi:undecaprenyl-phosphate 4-deoxy-4-formamido-L-arabinose transferase